MTYILYTVSNYIILSWRQLVRIAVVAALIRRAVVAALRPRQLLHTGLVLGFPKGETWKHGTLTT